MPKTISNIQLYLKCNIIQVVTEKIVTLTAIGLSQKQCVNTFLRGLTLWTEKLRRKLSLC